MSVTEKELMHRANLFVYDSDNDVWVPLTQPATSILTADADFVFTSPAANDVVVYDGGTGKFINSTLVSSGVYTPTRSAESNLDANAIPTEAQYIRVFNTVTVSGRFTADPTAAGAASFQMTLPVASNLGAAEDAAGVAFCGGIAGQGAEIIGVAATDTVKVQWIAVDTTSKVWSYSFTYQII